MTYCGDPLRVHTARISYRGEDRLDVTAKSAAADAKAFAPTWPLVNWGLKMREEAKKKAAYGDPNAASFEEWHWKLYVMRYTEQMRYSYATRRPAWDALLKREHVVLVCYCAEPLHCHRRVLADVLVTLGAHDLGELGDDDNNQEARRGAP
jgi:uncharacterized protein YeaO (DUF488 family)